MEEGPLFTMYSNEDLTAAVKAGVMTDDVAKAFRDHVAAERVTPIVDEEHFRLITGFNDIFVVIACLLLLISVSWIATSINPILGGVAQAITAWGLAEYFTRQRRMSLPSIVLLLAFVGGVFIAGLAFLENISWSEDITTGLPAAAAALAAWLHWQRFNVPITVAAGIATVVTSVMFLLFGFVPEAREWVTTIAFIAGVLVFLLAMWWDSSDIQRQTRRSDVAFWLHLVAAPLLVHPIFAGLDIFDSYVGFWQAVLVTLLYIIIAIISVSIDRRALMVSALIYVLYAFNTLLEQYGVVSLGFAFAALTIGSGLLILSAFWHNCRQFIVVRYPLKLQQRLPSLK